MLDGMVGATEHGPATQAPAKSHVLWERSGEETHVLQEGLKGQFV